MKTVKNTNQIRNVIRGKKRNISLVFITQSYFAVPKYIIQISKSFNKSHLIIYQILT